MAEKTLSQLFYKYTPSVEQKRIMDMGIVEKAFADTENRRVKALTKFPSIISKRDLHSIEKAICESDYNLNNVEIAPIYDRSLFTMQYLIEIIEEAKLKKIIAKGFFQQYEAYLEDDVIIIEIMFNNGGVEFVENSKVCDFITDLIKSEFGISFPVEIRTSKKYSEETKTKVPQRKTENTNIPKAEIINIEVETERKSSLGNDEIDDFIDENGYHHLGHIIVDLNDGELIFGDETHINNRIKPLRFLKDSSASVCAVGLIFGAELKEIKNKQNKKLKIYTFCITDKDTSISCKRILSDEEASELISLDKYDGALIVSGKYEYDSFSSECVLNFDTIKKVKKQFRMDNSPEKRVELHLHTKMSTMDALIDPGEIVEVAKKWGHSAVGITDHGNVQGFQKAMLKAEKLGMKVLYGIEGYLVDDTAKIIYGDDKSVSFDDEFIAFDTETTGLSSFTCKLIEIGAVKVKNGEVLERFDTFVNPGIEIPKNITELTSITNEMVADAPTPEIAVKQFLEFVGNRTLIAHNASFDMSFIRKVCEDNGYEFENTYIDTVSMSKLVNPNLKKHKLNIIAEYYNLPEFHHHRASDDAEMCAQIFYQMIEKMKGEGIDNVDKMNSSMGESIDPKKLKPYHIILYAQNKTGLKNLYRLISASYLQYFKSTPKIPKTLLQKYREGIIVGSACEAGELFRALIDGNSWDELLSIAEFYDYLEIQPISNNGFLVREGRVNDDEGLRDLNRTIVKIGDELKKPVCATCDAHFLNKEDEISRKILLSGLKFKDGDNDLHLYMRTTEEMLDEFSYLGKEKAFEVVVKNTNMIADMIESNIRPFPEGTFTPKMEGAEEDLVNRCYAKAKKLYGDPLPEIVSQRLEKELSSIIKNGFAVLYIIAQKLVSYSEQEGYLVGSRGSVGSSFVASMGGISEVNPLPPHYYCPDCQYSEFFLDGSVGSGFDLPDKTCPKCGGKLKGDGHNIPFETFLGFHGEKSPDIDLNFSGEVQGKVHKFTEELFGSENVFRAGTISALASNTAFGFVNNYLDDRHISIPSAERKRLVDSLVGVKRTTGQHPGGIVVVPKENDIYDFCPVQHPADDPNSNIVTTHFTFEYLHDTLLKLDELGHDIPTKYKMIERFTKTNVMNVPMNDPLVYQLFTSTAPLGVSKEDIRSDIGTLGMPEMGTPFVQGVLVQAKPKSFADLLQVSGITHGTDVWLGNAQTLINNGICDVSSVIGTRDSIMLSLINYGVESSLSFKIMEKVRKGKGVLPEEEQAMIDSNVPSWFIDSCKKIKYLFPKAHAAAYVMSAIRLGWYKVHMPLEFYCAFLSAAPGGFDSSIAMKGKSAVCSCLDEIEAKSEKTQKDAALYNSMMLANEFLARGFKFLPVDLYKSDYRLYLPEDGCMRLPFNSLPGLGDAAAQNLQNAREDGEYLSVEDLQQRTGISSAVINILEENGVLKNLSETNQMTLF